MSLPLVEDMSTGSADSETDSSVPQASSHKVNTISTGSSSRQGHIHLRQVVSNLPSFNSKDWYTNKCFDRYWSHYNYVLSWCAKHHRVCKSLQRKYASRRVSQQFYPSPSPTYQQWGTSDPKPPAGKQKRKRGGRSAHKKRKQSDVQMEVNVEGVNVSDTTQDELSTSDVPSLVPIEDDMDISEEMLDFFAHSQKHRQERRAEKKAEKLREKEEKLMNIEDVKGQQRERTVEAPKERPGSRRTAEMKCLYGKGAAMIHGMETALQMTYDRNYDVNQPTYWPNMPFKINFASV